MRAIGSSTSCVVFTLTVVGMAFTLALVTWTLTAAATEEAKPSPAVQKGTSQAESPKTDGAKPDPTKTDSGKTESVKKDVHGPALSAPREIFELLEQRKRMLDKREATLRGSETHRLEMKAELEQIVTRHEQAAKNL